MAKKVKTTEENRENVKTAIQAAYPQYFEAEAPEGTIKVITKNGLKFIDIPATEGRSFAWDDSEGALLTMAAAKASMNRYDYSRVIGVESTSGYIARSAKDSERNEAIKGAIFSFMDRLPDSDIERATVALKLLAECLRKNANNEKHARVSANVLALTAEFLEAM